MVISRVLTFALLAVCASYVHAGQYWVSVGSYRQAENAEHARSVAVQSLDERASIERITVDERPMFRVLVGPQASEQRARELVAAARTIGFATAWLLELPATQTTAPAASAAEVPVASPPNAASADATPAELPEHSEPPEQAVSPTVPADPVGNDVTEALPALQEAPVQPSAGTLPETLTLTAVSGEPITLLRLDLEREPIKVDGALDEPFWQRIPAIDQFLVLEPDTLVPGAHETFLRVAYSNKG